MRETLNADGVVDVDGDSACPNLGLRNSIGVVPEKLLVVLVDRAILRIYGLEQRLVQKLV